MVIVQMPHNPPCPDCGGQSIEERWISYTFVGPEGEKLKATHMAPICLNPDCCCIITDWRGEDARMQAYRDYLLHKREGISTTPPA